MMIVIGMAYVLSGMVPAMWNNTHRVYGQPNALAVIYLGALQGTRLWHLFEVQIDGADAGVLTMNDDDLHCLQIYPL